MLLVLPLNLIQVICVIEGWLSYFLHYIFKQISKVIFILAIVTFVWWPLDLLCGVLWAGCECLRRRLASQKITFSEALMLWTNFFPTL